MKPTVAEALEALVKHFDTVYSHNAECCFTETQALVERARQALRSARYSLGSSS